MHDRTGIVFNKFAIHTVSFIKTNKKKKHTIFSNTTGTRKYEKKSGISQLIQDLYNYRNQQISDPNPNYIYGHTCTLQFRSNCNKF